ncbi:MAG: GNAT family N-acetyltransferase [Acidobacteriota bacterium]|nr:GNAT family N-acetyltransferase [Acidobacteriota bacterium]
MPVLGAVTNPSILQQIYDETWPIWGDRLSRANYERYNRAQMLTEWGKTHLDRVAWTDGDDLLASAKRYRLSMSVDGQDVRALGIGAVFTPAAHRGRGHAAALIEALVAEAADQGSRYALLFSEIGSEFYARLGFTPLPIDETMIELKVQPREGSPAVLVRGGDERDIAAISAMHDARRGRYRMSLERSKDYVRYALARRRLLAAFGAPGAREVEFFIIEEGATAAAYVVISRGPDGPVLEDFGDRDPTGARVGAMLQVLAARTPAEPMQPLRAWLPVDFHPVQIERVSAEPARDVAMIRGIGAAAPALNADDLFFMKGDAF